MPLRYKAHQVVLAQSFFLSHPNLPPQGCYEDKQKNHAGHPESLGGTGMLLKTASCKGKATRVIQKRMPNWGHRRWNQQSCLHQSNVRYQGYTERPVGKGIKAQTNK